MDEYIDILNEKNEITGDTCLKSYAHKYGIYHASIHVWIFNKNKDILIQKRAHNKDTFPNLWDISVAGHISAGEKPIISALREVKEEVGISIFQNQLHFIGNSKRKVKHVNNIVDYEYHHIYLCQIEFDINNLSIQEEEVDAIKTIKLNDFIAEVDLSENNFVPRSAEYYEMVLTQIKNFK